MSDFSNGVIAVMAIRLSFGLGLLFVGGSDAIDRHELLSAQQEAVGLKVAVSARESAIVLFSHQPGGCVPSNKKRRAGHKGFLLFPTRVDLKLRFGSNQAKMFTMFGILPLSRDRGGLRLLVRRTFIRFLMAKIVKANIASHYIKHE